MFLIPGSDLRRRSSALWQLAVLAWLSPGSLAENWALLRQTSEGAAFVFSPATSRQSMLELLGVNGYFGMLLPALAYTAWRARRKNLHDQMWGVVWLVAVANLGWYVVASLGWMRYAFVGLMLSSPAGGAAVARPDARLVAGPRAAAGRGRRA